MAKPTTYDEALDTVIARALRWARIQEQSRHALESLGEDVDARIAELDEAVEIVRRAQLSAATWLTATPATDGDTTHEDGD